MSDINLIASIAKVLNSRQADSCVEVLLDYARGLSANQVNELTFLLVMCVNKELAQGKLSQYVSERYHIAKEALMCELPELKNNRGFSRFLDELGTSLSGREQMRQLVLSDFVVSHRIELPCMYVAAWDFHDFCKTFGDSTFDSSFDSKIVSVQKCLLTLSTQLRNAIFCGTLTSEDGEVISIEKLLPTLQSCSDGLTPVILSTAIANLLIENESLRQEHDDLAVLYQRNITLLEHFNHNWKDISYHTIIYNAAEALLNESLTQPQRQTLSGGLRRAYNNERILIRELELLHAISDVRGVRNRFRVGFLISGGTTRPGIVSVHDLFDAALEIVTLRLVMDDIDRTQRMVERRARIANLKNLQVDYTERFLTKIKQDSGLLEWVRKNLFDITLDISDEWNDVRFKEESFAASQVIAIFVELLINAFLHGEGTRMDLRLATSDLTLDICETNACPTNAKIDTTRKGVTTLTAVVNAINYGSGLENGVEVTLNRAIYSICVKLDKSLMYKKEEY